MMSLATMTPVAAEVVKELLTAHVGVVDNRFAPHAAAVVLIGADAELVGRVGFQVINDCVACRACLVDPLPVPLSVADSVEPEGDKGAGRCSDCLKSAFGVPQGSSFGPFEF